MMHVDLYARDCLHFIKTFLEKSGLGTGRVEPRSLVELQGEEDETMALEVRNKMLLRNSFFHTAFEPNREVMQRAGLLFSADSDRTVRNDMLCIQTTLEPGFSQLADGGASMTNQSFWVTSSGGGFFYVLSFAPIQTANKKFTTPLFTLKAGVTTVTVLV